ncbi:hypothetical protein EDC04DRAFT_2661556 [Pisolithus marmoratus]|nr:hypothetical protein EDC04DRAFT_2661556 [Pisolithus marmoratus]
MLVLQSRPTTSTGGSQSPNAKATKEATKYFSDLFGIEHFESYVGKITFFDKLFTGLELSLDSETLEVVHDCSINLLAKMLRGRMVRANPISRERMRGVKREIAAISKTLGVRLLQEMKAGYIQTYDVLYPLKGKLSKSCMDYDLSKPITEYIGSLPQPVTVSGHGGIRDKVQVIKTLQTKLDATEDIDEQLALEEDITGRILWTCHSGLRSVVGHIPAKKTTKFTT